MQSKTWCCKLSRPLILKDITRFWPIWSSYLAIWLMLLPIPLLNSLVESRSGRTDVLCTVYRQIVTAGGNASLVMTLIFGGLSAAAVWSYLFQSRSASLFHALPVTRGTLFVSHFAAGLGFMAVPNVLLAAVTYLCQLSAGCTDPMPILHWLAAVCLESLLFFSIGTLAAMLTGSLPAMPVLYGLLNFAAAACESLWSSLACLLYYGVSSLSARLTFLSPFIRLVAMSPGKYVSYVPAVDAGFSQQLQQFDPDYLRYLVRYGLAALALAAAALLLYRRRATEAAGDVIAVPRLRPAAKYAFSLFCSLALGWIFQSVFFPGHTGALSLFLCMAAGGAVGYIAAAMLLKKSFRVFRPRQMAGLLAVFVLLGGCVLCLRFDVLQVESRVPAAEDVASVTVYCDRTLTLSDPGGLRWTEALHRTALNPEERADPDTVPSEERLYFTLEYQLKDGSALSRNYCIPYTPDRAEVPASAAGQLIALMRQPAYALSSLLPPEDAVYENIELSLHTIRHLAAEGRGYEYDSCPVYSVDGDALTAALREDILAGRIGIWDPIRGGREAMLDLSFDYSLPGDRDTRWSYLTIYADEQPTRTLEVLTELGYLMPESEAPHA